MDNPTAHSDIDLGNEDTGVTLRVTAQSLNVLTKDERYGYIPLNELPRLDQMIAKNHIKDGKE